MLAICNFWIGIFSVWIIVASQHFMDFAMFFAAAYIYVDKLADEDVRHSAQTVFGIIILGGVQLLVVGFQVFYNL